MSDQVPIGEIPDWMCLPPDIDEMAVIVPMSVPKAVKAGPDDIIRCQWEGCEGSFKATELETRKHFKTEHLKECSENETQSRRITRKKRMAGNSTRDEEDKELRQKARWHCHWLVNNRVPCEYLNRKKDSGNKGREEGYTFRYLSKHIALHLFQEGLPSPWVKESECCGYVFFPKENGITQKHSNDCRNGEGERRRIAEEENKKGKKRKLDDSEDDV